MPKKLIRAPNLEPRAALPVGNNGGIDGNCVENRWFDQSTVGKFVNLKTWPDVNNGSLNTRMVNAVTGRRKGPRGRIAPSIRWPGQADDPVGESGACAVNSSRRHHWV